MRDATSVSFRQPFLLAREWAWYLYPVTLIISEDNARMRRQSVPGYIIMM